MRVFLVSRANFIVPNERLLLVAAAGLMPAR
jgi:hypothetical protein